MALRSWPEEGSVQFPIHLRARILNRRGRGENPNAREGVGFASLSLFCRKLCKCASEAFMAVREDEGGSEEGGRK